MEKICEQCGIIFIVNKNIKRCRDKIFCSRKCAGSNNGVNNKGRKFSDEVNKTKGLCGELNPMFGKYHSDELKKQIKETKLITNIKNAKYCNLSDIEKEVLDGIMVSDGSLTSVNNVSGRISLGFKYSEMLEYIKASLPSIEFSVTNISKTGLSYHNKSKMYRDLLFENKRWYLNGVKIVPDDLRITNVSCYWWFICDGYNTNNNVYLCTESFTLDENLLLCSKFKKLGFTCKLTSKNRIRFFKNDSIEFLKWIKPENGVHKRYNYKWKN